MSVSRRPLSPAAYRRVAFLALLSLVFIVVTGGAVRLTGSGLGCPEWPNCGEGRLVAPFEYHAMVEFVNRTLTGLVSLAVVLAVLGSRRRQPRRQDLVWLSWGLVAGVLVQGILGGITVKVELAPPFVMAHFLLSMVLVANAVVLHWRAGEPQTRAHARIDRPPAGGDFRRFGTLILATTALVVFLGTVLTAAGPHGGDEKAERLDVPIHRAAQVHGTGAMLLLAMVVAMLFLLSRSRYPDEVRQQGRVLLAVVLAQAGIGYLQYFTGVPVLLVGAHIAGATLLWATAVRFRLGLGEAVVVEHRPAAQAPPGEADLTISAAG
jgi:cytochrome c oxidase assembly protein subunit 15